MLQSLLPSQGPALHAMSACDLSEEVEIVTADNGLCDGFASV